MPTFPTKNCQLLKSDQMPWLGCPKGGGVSEAFIKLSLPVPEELFFDLSTQGGGQEVTVGFFIAGDSDKNVEQLIFFGRESLIASHEEAKTGAMNRALRPSRTTSAIDKKKNISRRERRNDTEYVLDRLLTLCGQDLYSLSIMQILVPHFLRATEIVMVALFQWSGNHSFPVVCINQCLFLGRGCWLPSVS